MTILEGRGREEAQQAEAEIRAGEWKGPLHGIPWGVKDLFSVTGAPTTWGAEAFQDQVIEEDAEVVRRMREAGAVLIAKLSTGEFARGDQWYRGRTKNPWNVEQGSSGSSAGPASATAAGCVAFGIGSETQGSITSPARRCGLSALRPTFGRVSRYGGMVLAWSMDKVGPLCRSVEDCALVFNTIHGADEKDPATLTTPFRFQRNSRPFDFPDRIRRGCSRGFCRSPSGPGCRSRSHGRDAPGKLQCPERGIGGGLRLPHRPADRGRGGGRRTLREPEEEEEDRRRAGSGGAGTSRRWTSSSPNGAGTSS